jgi:hypothetical protein
MVIVRQVIIYTDCFNWIRSHWGVKQKAQANYDSPYKRSEKTIHPERLLLRGKEVMHAETLAWED